MDFLIVNNLFNFRILGKNSTLYTCSLLRCVNFYPFLSDKIQNE